MNRHLLIVGNSKYENKDFVDLDYAKKDAELIYDLLINSQTSIFSANTSICRFDVKRDDFDNLLDEFFEPVSQDDLVLVYFAGHSRVIPGKKRLFLAMADTNPLKLARSGFDY